MFTYRNYRIVEVRDTSREGEAQNVAVTYDVFQEDGLEVKAGFATIDEAKAYIDSISF
jgi:hypothetical protein